MPNCLKAVKNTTCIVKISAQAYVLICACMFFLKKHTKHFLSIIYINTCFQTHNLAIFLSWLEIPPRLAKKYTHIVNQITKYVRDQLNNFLTSYFVLPLVTLLKFCFFFLNLAQVPLKGLLLIFLVVPLCLLGARYRNSFYYCNY